MKQQALHCFVLLNWTVQGLIIIADEHSQATSLQLLTNSACGQVEVTLGDLNTEPMVLLRLIV